MYKIIASVIAIVVATGIVVGLHTNKSLAPVKTTSASAVVTTTKPAAPKAAPVASVCAANNLSQEIIVSIAKRHLWACNNSQQVYDSAVITGNMNLAADLTPTGTYHIYSKQTNRYLTGSDSTGSWNDYVYYWMPFLDNKYGTYGFHDATWRGANDFGNIDPYSSQASHGCVEMPLATTGWLYKWSSIGTAVVITS